MSDTKRSSLQVREIRGAERKKVFFMKNSFLKGLVLVSSRNVWRMLEALFRKGAELLETGERLLVKGETRKAEKALRSATRRLKGDKRLLADAMINLGVALYRNGKIKASLKTFRDALRICEEAGYLQGVARSYSGLGLTYSSLNKSLDEALKYHEKALEAAKNAGSIDVEARVLSNMGLTYLMGDKPEDALRVLREAVEKASENYVKATALTNMANALRVMGWLREEVDARRKAIELLDELGDVRGATINRVEMAFALKQLRRFNEALEVAEEARKMFMQVKEKRMVKVAEELVKGLRVRERVCSSCGAVIAVDGLEYCPICDTSLVEEKRRRLWLGRMREA